VEGKISAVNYIRVGFITKDRTRRGSIHQPEEAWPVGVVFFFEKATAFHSAPSGA